jgi:hypothetical protein
MTNKGRHNVTIFVIAVVFVRGAHLPVFHLGRDSANGEHCILGLLLALGLSNTWP